MSERLSENVRDHCYRFLDRPVIITAGDVMTPFFINGEKLLGNHANDYKKYEMNPIGMSNWIKGIMNSKNEIFFNSMSDVKNALDLNDVDIISGGRTRDWPFAIGLAELTDKPVMFLYKPQDSSNPIVITPDGDTYSPRNIKGKKVLHIVDLVTKASSIVGKGGWLDQIQELDGYIDNVYAVIDRNQGASQVLAQKGVRLQTGVRIDNDWLLRHDSEHADEVAKYLADEKGWTLEYLSQNGIGSLIPYLDSSQSPAKKDNRLLKFLHANNDDLRERGLVSQILDNTDIYKPVSDPSIGLEGNESLSVALQKYQSSL